jgi:hypothetical protein
MLARAANLDEFPGHDTKFRNQTICQIYPKPGEKKAAIAFGGKAGASDFLDTGQRRLRANLGLPGKCPMTKS